MTWTTRTPTHSGIWWVRNAPEKPARTLTIRNYAGHLYCSLGYLDALDSTWQWSSEPIKEPEEE